MSYLSSWSSFVLRASDSSLFFTLTYFKCVCARARASMCAHAPQHTCRSQTTVLWVGFLLTWLPRTVSLGNKCLWPVSHLARPSGVLLNKWDSFLVTQLCRLWRKLLRVKEGSDPRWQLYFEVIVFPNMSSLSRGPSTLSGAKSVPSNSLSQRSCEAGCLDLLSEGVQPGWTVELTSWR